MKGGGKPTSFDASKLTLPEEQALVREIARLPQVVADAVADDEPSTLSRYLLDVASALSRWYTAGNQDREKRVIVDDPALKAAMAMPPGAPGAYTIQLVARDRAMIVSAVEPKS